MATEETAEKTPFPTNIRDFIIAFMRAINTARLYSSDHALFKEQSQHLYEKFTDAVADRNFLFLGFARDSLFLDGTFHEPKEPQVVKFLQFFHLLRISHLLLDKDAAVEELESSLGLLAGARQGQGDEVANAIQRENVKRVKVGLLDYSVFSSAATISAHLAHANEEEAIWRQLILLPAGTGVLNLGPEQIRQLLQVSEDVEEFKKILQEMEAGLDTDKQQTPSAHKGALLANFIQNLAAALANIAPDKRQQFARQVNAVINTLKLNLRLQILGSVPAEAVDKEDGNVILEIFQAMPDDQMVQLLATALEEGGAESPYFLSMFHQALSKYKDPSLLLTLVRTEMNKATQEGTTRNLKNWQYLEQLIVHRQETADLNEQYRKEIEALNTSLHMEVAFAEDKEIERLLETMTPASLQTARTQLTIDLLRQHQSSWGEALFAPMLNSLGAALGDLYSRKEFVTIGSLVRQLLLVLTGHPQEESGREIVESMLSTEDIRELLDNLLEQCQTYSPSETIVINAICQLYPEKAGVFLLDVLESTEGQESEQAQWLLTTLAGLGPQIASPLGRKLQSCPDPILPSILTLVAATGIAGYATMVGKLLQHRNLQIRLQAIATLGKLRAGGVVPQLAGIVLKRSLLTGRKEKPLQEAALRALAEIGTEEAKSAIEKAAEQGPDDLKALCKELGGH
jgi:hypothetical protein